MRQQIIVQTYSSPIPRGTGFRDAQSGSTRQTVGGCGLWNKDADWANDFAVPTINNSAKNSARADRSVELRRDSSMTRRPGAADKTEWVSQIRTTSTIFGPYQLQEDAHPSYWGQLALRNCLRQAYNGGAARGGACTIASTGLNAIGEPLMVLR